MITQSEILGADEAVVDMALQQLFDECLNFISLTDLCD